MKPIYKWIEELPENYRKEAEFNMLNYPLSDRNDLVNSLKEALLKAFILGRGYGTINQWVSVYFDNYKTLF